MLRTRRYPLEDLRAADVGVGRTGFNGFDREFLILHRADGGSVEFKELSAKPGSDADPSVVRRAAKSINQQPA